MALPEDPCAIDVDLRSTAISVYLLPRIQVVYFENDSLFLASTSGPHAAPNPMIGTFKTTYHQYDTVVSISAT